VLVFFVSVLLTFRFYRGHLIITTRRRENLKRRTEKNKWVNTKQSARQVFQLQACTDERTELLQGFN